MASASPIALQLKIQVQHSLQVFTKLGVRFLFHLFIGMASARLLVFQLQIFVKHSLEFCSKLGFCVDKNRDRSCFFINKQQGVPAKAVVLCALPRLTRSIPSLRFGTPSAVLQSLTQESSQEGKKVFSIINLL